MDLGAQDMFISPFIEHYLTNTRWVTTLGLASAKSTPTLPPLSMGEVTWPLRQQVLHLPLTQPSTLAKKLEQLLTWKTAMCTVIKVGYHLCVQGKHRQWYLVLAPNIGQSRYPRGGAWCQRRSAWDQVEVVFQGGDWDRGDHQRPPAEQTWQGRGCTGHHLQIAKSTLTIIQSNTCIVHWW